MLEDLLLPNVRWLEGAEMAVTLAVSVLSRREERREEKREQTSLN